jgi:hypothetical protein
LVASRGLRRSLSRQGFWGQPHNRPLARSPKKPRPPTAVPVQLERRGTTSQMVRRSPMFPPLLAPVQPAGNTARSVCHAPGFEAEAARPRAASASNARSAPAFKAQRDRARTLTVTSSPRPNANAHARSRSRRTARQARSRLRSPCARRSQRWQAKRLAGDQLAPLGRLEWMARR